MISKSQKVGYIRIKGNIKHKQIKESDERTCKSFFTILPLNL